LDLLALNRRSPAEEFLLVTYHPVTLEPGQEGTQADALVEALQKIERPCVVTAPNADPGNRAIRARLEKFCRRDSRSMFVENAGAEAYASLMSRAAAMVGNSSSGLIEAPAFELPVVNIGSRQEGRQRARNVIDCGYDVANIVRAIRKALQPSFRRSLRGLTNPYGDGHAAERIVSRLESVALDERLLRKRFHDS
jgi:UDP-hydrolysing UDP-N-acetyl-D-glucosamine 2-epimerase